MLIIPSCKKKLGKIYFKQKNYLENEFEKQKVEKMKLQQSMKVILFLKLVFYFTVKLKSIIKCSLIINLKLMFFFLIQILVLKFMSEV